MSGGDVINALTASPVVIGGACHVVAALKTLHLIELSSSGQSNNGVLFLVTLSCLSFFAPPFFSFSRLQTTDGNYDPTLAGLHSRPISIKLSAVSVMNGPAAARADPTHCRRPKVKLTNAKSRRS